jgi:hypothetical protein
LTSSNLEIVGRFLATGSELDDAIARFVWNEISQQFSASRRKASKGHDGTEYWSLKVSMTCYRYLHPWSRPKNNPVVTRLQMSTTSSRLSTIGSAISRNSAWGRSFLPVQCIFGAFPCNSNFQTKENRSRSTPDCDRHTASSRK